MCTAAETPARCGRDVHIGWCETLVSLSVMAEGSAARDALGQAPNEFEGLGVVGKASGGAPAGVEDRRVVATAEGAADGRQRLRRVVAREGHGGLARPGQA